ncbi:MAG TPA: metallophosphoesterase [Gemmatimonadaceae bacterium]|nr:metallophosphoesterase [Gemmatimonadaceae bacterium]
MTRRIIAHLSRAGAVAGVLAPLLLACFPPVRVTPPPAAAPAADLAIAGAAVLIGVGDIARCGWNGDEATARLVDSVLLADSVAGVEDAVFTVGDHAYPDGTDAEFERCFGESWGDSTKRIMKRIRPAIGNHENNTAFGAPYYRYFGERAGPAGRGYYSYRLGEWHIFVLNSEMMTNSRYGAAERQAQLDWLRENLEENQTRCAIAYMHRPLFSSGGHRGEPLVRALWEVLFEGGVDVVLTGHEHHYERFAPMTPGGVRDTVRGMTQFIVGTGGADLRGLRNPEPNSVTRIQGHYGVLKLTLGREEYRHAFLDTQGRIWDPGGGRCSEIPER